MRKFNIFNFRYHFLFALLLLSLFYYFRGGSLTKVEFKFNNVADSAEIFVDRNKVGNFSFGDILDGKIGVSVVFFETFTPKEIKQEVLKFYVEENGRRSFSKKNAVIFNSVDELKGKSVGVEIKNLEQGGIHLNLGDQDKYSVYLRPLRENDWALAKTKNKKETFLEVSNHVPLNAWQQLRKIGMIMTEPFPYLVLFMIFVYFSKEKKAFTFFGTQAKFNPWIFRILLSVGFLASFSWFFYLNQHFIEGIPHVGDAISYLMQGKFLAEGKVCGVPKIPPELFDFFKGWGPLLFNNGRWCGYYPFGHPLMLALGVLIGIPGIIPPLVASLSLLFIFLIGRKVGNWKIGIFAWVITFVSPFFQMNAASFMSHNTAVFYEIVGFYFLITAVMDRKRLYFFASGVFLGLLFNTRPLTAIGIAAPILVYLLLSKVKFSDMLLFFISCFQFSSIYFLYNYLSFGTLWKTPYLQNNLFLFAKGNTPLTNYSLIILTHLITFLTVFQGWPFVFSLFLFFFSIMAKKTKEIVFFFLSTIGIVLIWGFSDGGTYSITYGPRYWFEIIPFISLIFSFSIYYFSRLFGNKIWGVIVHCVLAAFIFYTILGWVKGKPVLWEGIGFTPAKIEELKGFNSTDARLIKRTKELKITNAVIFVKNCGGNWWCYGSVLPQNNSLLDSDIVWATDLGGRNRELVNYYQGRTFYLADYDKNEIIPY